MKTKSGKAAEKVIEHCRYCNGWTWYDATIETADVVIQDDMPSKIPIAINIGKQTKKIVW